MDRGRKRKYDLDSHEDEIAELLASGATHQQIADKLADVFDGIDIQHIYRFCRAKNLKSRVTCGCRDDRVYIPRCDGCDKCIEVMNTTKHSKERVCMELRIIVSRSCSTSPMDCPKRKTNKHELERRSK